ncbi:hypothetical protein GOP47_0000098 [Adiantum capillus-veneris]|uniref:Uncharacterized protein n=1 Tax=Adiantum capillus-veneris TaxID=13818 RepID=A0A9D4VD91_ADICA|nr:hypothetical protein GOP47_0000098 [Adiantum capillus-veneris]
MSGFDPFPKWLHKTCNHSLEIVNEYSSYVSKDAAKPHKLLKTTLLCILFYGHKSSQYIPTDLHACHNPFHLGIMHFCYVFRKWNHASLFLFFPHSLCLAMLIGVLMNPQGSLLQRF